MKKPTLLTSLSLAALLGVTGVGTAVAIGDNPAPTPGQTLADYMGDDNDAQWDKVQTWVEAEYGEGATVPADPQPEPEPEPTTEPTAEPTTEPEPSTPAGPELTDATVTATDDNRIVLTGKVTGTTEHLTFRASAYEFTDQAGYPVQVTPAADGTIRAEVEDFNNTDPKYWQLEVGGSTWTHGEVFASGEIGADAPVPEPTTDPEPEPTTPPTTGGDTTGGTGGEFTDRQFQTFSSAGLTSEYHIYAEGIDTSKPVGILMYGDGSGGYGFDNPAQSYLIGGSNGLAATAQKHNMILVVPEAPAPGCDGTDNCWYNSSGSPTPAQKAAWSAALLDEIKGQYDIATDRIVTGGYSSGAQWHRWFLPAHAEDQGVDLAVMIAYGGAPAVPADFSNEYKDELTLVWDTGKNDSAYSSASYGAIGGYNWYTGEGFTTVANWPDGVGHSRGGEFGGIIDQAITEHLD